MHIVIFSSGLLSYKYLASTASRVKAEPETTYYMDDPSLPMYSDVCSPFNCSELIHVLLTDNMDSRKICGTRPLAVSQNATFIIDLDRVQFDDLKADDLGSWKQNGSKRTYFRLDDRGQVLYRQGSAGGKGYYCLLRRYYVHGTCSTFHRLIVCIEGMG